MPWATVQQVLDVTGEDVSTADLAVASAMIDTKAGTSEDLPADALSARDRGILRKATIWQAPWIKANPGLLTDREAATQTSAAGTSDRRESITAIMYAPLAILELRNLSWAGTRTEYVPPTRPLPPNASFLNEASDGYGQWRAL